MGLNPFWQEDFFLTLQDLYPSAAIIQTNPHFLIQFGASLIVHLVPIANKFASSELIALQTHYEGQKTKLVHLWEDVWLARRSQVLNRIRHFLGLNKTLHGRKSEIINLTANQAKYFFESYHLQGHVKAGYFFGLNINGVLVAAAGFSKLRPMPDKGPNYRSVELVRFASKDHFTVVGGLSKLVKHFLKNISVNDLMTYADRDWSLGTGYEQLNFTFTAVTPPAQLYVNKNTLQRYFPHRLPSEVTLDFKSQELLNLDDYLKTQGFLKIFNTGNLKFHLYP